MSLIRATSSPHRQVNFAGATEPAKVALIVGRHGLGQKIAMKLAENMDLAITHISDEGAEDAKKASHFIRALPQVPYGRKVRQFKFDPKQSSGATTLTENVVNSFKRLDIVVFASVYAGTSQDKSELFDAEVSAFYAIYQAAMRFCSGHFRIIHVSSRSSSEKDHADVALEALIRTFGEELRAISREATVNAIKIDSKGDDDDVIKMVTTLAAKDSSFISGQIIRGTPAQ